MKETLIALTSIISTIKEQKYYNGLIRNQICIFVIMM